MPNMRLKSASFILLGLLLGGAASGKSTDRNQPMEISADRSDALLTDDGESSISGNVNISQGSLQIKADNAVVSRVKGETVKVTLNGTPARMQQMNDNGELMKASAKQIVYLLNAEQVSLLGNVIIDQPRGSMRGESIRYDIKSGRLTGGGDGTRVQMRLEPKTPVKK
jgi:lipopolysaccharide export system protein LptA